MRNGCTINLVLPVGISKLLFAYLDWYYRKTTDLINSVYVSAGSNFRNKVTSNIGSLHNTGFELATIVRPIQTKDLRWEINYNLTYNKNKIDELVGGNSAGYLVETGGVSAGTFLLTSLTPAETKFHVFNPLDIFQERFFLHLPCQSS
jgi:hypothetical protein